MRQAKLGVPKSEEHRRTMSLTRKGRPKGRRGTYRPRGAHLFFINLNSNFNIKININ